MPATLSASASLTSFLALSARATVSQRAQQITITPTAVPSYGVVPAEGVTETPFVSSTVTVPALTDGIYDN